MLQTLSLGCISYEQEVKEATLNKYTRQQQQAHKPLLDYAKDIEDVRANSVEIGGQLARLEEMVH